VSKAIDKAAGAEREVVGLSDNARATVTSYKKDGRATVNALADSRITAPATDAARQWSGWGTALKPSYEPIIVARKPLVGTVAENVLRYGTGGINVDGCRVGIECSDLEQMSGRSGKRTSPHLLQGMPATSWEPTASGRWPANLIHDGSEEVVGLFPHANARNGGNTGTDSGGVYSGTWGNAETLQYRDSGSAARFFYCAKASKADREEGLASHPERDTALKYNGGDGFAGRTLVDGEWVNTDKSNRTKPRNHHPTVKPTALMRYLCRLVTPPGGIVLDPFAGSGSTGKGAVLEGFRFIGIEREAEYVEIARARIAAVAANRRDLFS
jgi:hypothetical protein